MAHPRDGEDGTDAPGDPAGPWPPTFPHLEIDDLLARLRESALSDPKEVAVLLGLVSKEAQRLRTTVVRLSLERLSHADEQAEAILREALDQSAALRRMGLEVLGDRLDEADRITAGMRALLGVEEATAQLLGRDTSAGGPGPDPWLEDG